MIEFREEKGKKASASDTVANKQLRAINQKPSNATLPQNGDAVKSNSMQKSENDADDGFYPSYGEDSTDGKPEVRKMPNGESKPTREAIRLAPTQSAIYMAKAGVSIFDVQAKTGVSPRTFRISFCVRRHRWHCAPNGFRARRLLRHRANLQFRQGGSAPRPARRG